MGVTKKLDFGNNNNNQNRNSQQSNRNSRQSTRDTHRPQIRPSGTSNKHNNKFRVKPKGNSNKTSIKQYAKFKPKVISNAQDKITSSETYRAVENYMSTKYQNKINDKVNSIEYIDNKDEESLLIVFQTIGKLNSAFRGTMLNHELSMIHNVRSIKLLSNVVMITQDSGTLNCIIKDNIHTFKKSNLAPAVIKNYSNVFENSMSDMFINANTIKSVQQTNLCLSKSIGISYEDGDLDLNKFPKDIGMVNLQCTLAEGYINIENNGCNITDSEASEIIIHYSQFDDYKTFTTFIRFLMSYNNYLKDYDTDELEFELKVSDDINFVNLTENSPEAKLKFFVQTQISMDSSMLPIKPYLDRNKKSPSLSFSNENVNVEILDINDKLCKYSIWLDDNDKKHERIISSAILNDSYEDIVYNIKFKYMYILAEVLPKILPINESVVSCIMGINVPINKPIAINFTLNPSFIRVLRKLKKLRINVQGERTRYLQINKSNVEWVKDKPKQAIIIPAINFSGGDTLVMFIQYLLTKGSNIYLSNTYINKEQELIERKNSRKRRRL